MHHMYTVAVEARRGHCIPWTGVPDNHEGAAMWVSESNPLQEQPMLLTAELPLQLLYRQIV